MILERFNRLRLWCVFCSRFIHVVEFMDLEQHAHTSSKIFMFPGTLFQALESVRRQRLYLRTSFNYLFFEPLSRIRLCLRIYCDVCENIYTQVWKKTQTAVDEEKTKQKGKNKNKRVCRRKKQPPNRISILEDAHYPVARQAATSGLSPTTGLWRSLRSLCTTQHSSSACHSSSTTPSLVNRPWAQRSFSAETTPLHYITNIPFVPSLSVCICLSLHGGDDHPFATSQSNPPAHMGVWHIFNERNLSHVVHMLEIMPDGRVFGCVWIPPILLV